MFAAELLSRRFLGARACSLVRYSAAPPTMRLDSGPSVVVDTLALFAERTVHGTLAYATRHARITDPKPHRPRSREAGRCTLCASLGSLSSLPVDEPASHAAPGAPTHRRTWSSCARRTGGPPSLLLWLWALRAAASLPCCGLQTSKTWIRSARRGSRRRASVTSPRPSPVHARGRSNKRISACVSATICGCTVGGDDDGNASTRPLYLRWPRGPPRRRRFEQRLRPARRRPGGDHHSPRA